VALASENHRIRDIAQVVAETIPDCQLEFAAGAGPDPRCYRVDFGKIHRQLPEFKPRWNARRGAEELYAAYRAAGLVIDDCEGPRFKRIDHLKHLMASHRVDATLRWRSA